MTRSAVVFCIILIIVLSSPAPAQLLGDIDCNGYAWEIQDAVLVARFLVDHCDLYVPPCPENSDFDSDGRALTIGDIIYFVYFDDPPDYPRHPQSDSLMVESAIAHPGDTISLPVWISTVDTIMGFQFLLETDTDYLQFDTLIADDNFELRNSDCDGNIYCVISQPLLYPVIYDPGTYHICDLIFAVNPEITQPVTTPILFSSSPLLALYSGFANTDFFLPVFVNAEIEVVPLTDVESEAEILPSDFEISVYPNPFNGAVNISVFSDSPTEICVYDILGRPVRSYAINAGNNLVKWDAADADGRPLSAGIYFIGGSSTRSFQKVLYLK